MIKSVFADDTSDYWLRLRSTYPGGRLAGGARELARESRGRASWATELPGRLRASATVMAELARKVGRAGLPGRLRLIYSSAKKKSLAGSGAAVSLFISLVKWNFGSTVSLKRRREQYAFRQVLHLQLATDLRISPAHDTILLQKQVEKLYFLL